MGGHRQTDIVTYRLTSQEGWFHKNGFVLNFVQEGFPIECSKYSKFLECCYLASHKGTYKDGTKVETPHK